MIEQWRIRKAIESEVKLTSTTGFSGFVAPPVSIAVYFERNTASMVLLVAPEILRTDLEYSGPWIHRRNPEGQTVSATATATEQLRGLWTPLLWPG